MAKITIKDKEYLLRMDVYAMEKIEEKWGDLKEALMEFKGKGRGKTKVIKEMFKILANSGQFHLGLPEDVTGEEINGMTLADLNKLSQTLTLTMDESLHAETVNGNEADDEVHDEYAEELERREKNA